MIVPGAYLPGTATVSRRTAPTYDMRSEEHTSELQSQSNLVCRLLLEKKKNNTFHPLRSERDQARDQRPFLATRAPRQVPYTRRCGPGLFVFAYSVYCYIRFDILYLSS